jgi:hypothetical protein
MVRLQPTQLEALDAWIAGRDEPRPSRPEAIRIILDAATMYDALNAKGAL